MDLVANRAHAIQWSWRLKWTIVYVPLLLSYVGAVFAAVAMLVLDGTASSVAAVALVIAGSQVSISHAIWHLTGLAHRGRDESLSDD